MGMLSKAPLIEVIFEIHWANKSSSGEFEWSGDEISFFPGQFNGIAKDKGFGYVERANLQKGPLDIPSLPFQATYRFRKEKNTWPCFQIGLGLFTANVTNEFYMGGWNSFKESIQLGLEILSDGHPTGFNNLPIVSTELRYIDGFTFADGETAEDFIMNNLSLKFELSDRITANPNLPPPMINPDLSFSLKCENPKGYLISKLQSGKINGVPGLISTTSVKSTNKDCPDISVESFAKWSQDAHELQTFFFENFLEPGYLESLK